MSTPASTGVDPIALVGIGPSPILPLRERNYQKLELT